MSWSFSMFMFPDAFSSILIQVVAPLTRDPICKGSESETVLMS